MPPTDTRPGLRAIASAAWVVSRGEITVPAAVALVKRAAQYSAADPNRVQAAKASANAPSFCRASQFGSGASEHAAALGSIDEPIPVVGSASSAAVAIALAIPGEEAVMPSG